MSILTHVLTAEQAHELKQLRRQKGLTQFEVAKRVGIGRVSFVNLEAGNRNTNEQELQALMALYGTFPDVFQLKCKPVKRMRLVENRLLAVTQKLSDDDAKHLLRYAEFLARSHKKTTTSDEDLEYLTREMFRLGEITSSRAAEIMDVPLHEIRTWDRGEE